MKKSVTIISDHINVPEGMTIEHILEACRKMGNLLNEVDIGDGMSPLEANEVCGYTGGE